MQIKGITDEDFLNYKVPSMYICSSTCNFKCDKESGTECCQNSLLVHERTINMPDDRIIERYLSNKITKAIVIAGLEPLDQTDEVVALIERLRDTYICRDTVVIYSGYYPDEVSDAVDRLRSLGNVVMKFGRFVPDKERKFDDVLGVWLASPNQFGKEL